MEIHLAAYRLAARHLEGVTPRVFDLRKVTPLEVDVWTDDGKLILGFPSYNETGYFVFTYAVDQEPTSEEAARITEELYEAASSLGQYWRNQGYPYAFGEGGRVKRVPHSWVIRLIVPLIRTSQSDPFTTD